ncbi:MAG TPA: FAD-binding oxidoreductase [Hyphomonadaceae bacterium]|jgi:FAD/FMN-containing dehydrogenase|nr:FAD-binding oxidoreductase [Hyphomonadaceae bacterium]
MADDHASSNIADLIGKLGAALGPKGVSTDPHEIEPHVRDWRGRWKGSTPVLVKPGSTEEVSRAMMLCAEHGVAVTPQGGNSGMVNGGVPYGEVLISLRRMNRVREVDVLNDAMTLEAGVILTRAQDVAEENGRLFPLSLGAEGVATIGGLISTNAGGVAVLRYGMMRDLVLGIEAVLPDGRIWNGLRGLRKDNTGYDLKQLFIGAEGTLGLVTAATLKLFPKPAVKETAWVALSSAKQAVELLARAKAASGGAVTGFEIVSQFCMALVLKHIPDVRGPLSSPAPWRVLIELSLPRADGAREIMEAILADALETGLIEDAAIAESEAQKAMMWKIRENISVAEKAHGKALKHDVAVPVSRVADFMVEGDALARRLHPGVDVIAFGHVGDGNIHFNITPPPGADQDQFVEKDGLHITKAINDLVCSLNGSISAEHGIGKLKRDELAWRKSAVEMDMMRAVKKALDPDNRMNPGRVV